jgi:hypothetical protein
MTTRERKRAMLDYHVFKGTDERLHMPAYPYTALQIVTHHLATGPMTYGAWVEDMDFDEDSHTALVKIGCYVMEGEPEIHAFTGEYIEIFDIACVCEWYIKAGGNVSDELKAKLLREEHVRGFQLFASGSAAYRPPHGGYPVATAA